MFAGEGPTRCTALNNPVYQVVIPVSDTFWNPPILAGVPNTFGYVVAVPPGIVANNFVINLFAAQQIVLTVP